ncbi:citrate lyase holo-[acyl-carrier protein] synthase [Photobacterium sp.]|uniref:citrate lyase holo-[acyl-carrier protein] synthase n=1 Tax=Photobacterium sp. TaxID=660 RepID=UPI00299D064B|nr:citrate lyase holo-[acyl-carrier protein] synthase [Photobacterium sp.]MDX1301390.1 citrate lyase holo-[acyl-carrier protein] synthase [Photobacterium sp.]
MLIFSDAETAPATGLFEHLVNVEDRIQRQQDWLKRYSQPLVTFTINIPGPAKNTSQSKTIFEQGIEALTLACADRGWSITTRQILHKMTGPEAIFIIDAPSGTLLKAAMIKIEHGHQLGRLMNLDVLDTDGQTISRSGYQMPKRKCLICGKEKTIFDRFHHHDLDEHLKKIRAMVERV